MTTLEQRRDCLGSTCMKWTASGELSAVDQARILERLAEVDENLSANRQPFSPLLGQR
ncbi:MAG: hypothetical protein RLZZ32_1985 [Cyanobacteriota bacterium]|jgi:hypothetical protein